MSFLEDWNRNFPRSWKEMSFDYRLMFLHHVCMCFVLWPISWSGILSVRTELILWAGFMAVLVSLSVRHRRAVRWHWPGVTKTRILWTVLGLLPVAIFFTAISAMAPLDAPHVLPWYLAGAGLILFMLLTGLKVTDPSKEEFLTRCGDQIPLAAISRPPMEAAWKRHVRTVYGVLFLMGFLTFCAFIYRFGTAYRSGTSNPTATRTASLSDHGRVVYVTPEEKQQVDTLESIIMVAWPTILGLGFLLHFTGIKMWQMKKNSSV